MWAVACGGGGWMGQGGVGWYGGGGGVGARGVWGWGGVGWGFEGRDDLLDGGAGDLNLGQGGGEGREWSGLDLVGRKAGSTCGGGLTSFLAGTSVPLATHRRTQPFSMSQCSGTAGLTRARVLCLDGRERDWMRFVELGVSLRLRGAVAMFTPGSPVERRRLPAEDGHQRGDAAGSVVDDAVLAASHARRRAVPEPLGEPVDEVGCLLSTARGAVPDRAP